MTGFPSNEHQRLAEDPDAWKQWGPYLAERAWGTVREDYSVDGDAWGYFPHDHARSRAYRWNEDGLAGICDAEQRLCMSFAFWNGVDPILKERIFGLPSKGGNHGEDAKEYWWYVDSTPTHSWMQWRYLYPQKEFPYGELVDVNAKRGYEETEYELIDTGVLDDDRWVISVDYAKDDPTNIGVRVSATNRGSATATLHVLPTLWFRNTWSWGDDVEQPSIAERNGSLVAEHVGLPTMTLTGSGEAHPLLCDNETNSERLWQQAGPQFPKDGIADHVLTGAATVNPDDVGTKGALWYQLEVKPNATATVYLRLSSTDESAPGEQLFDQRRRDADDFYATLTPASTSAEEASIMRQAFAGMLWTKQFYHYDVDRWIDGDPGAEAPPQREQGRNAHWGHLHNADIISMPDKWEYPWYAAWDLAFHAVPLAHLDPVFAKEQIELVLQETYMHPNGQLPAYEWSLEDVNPPVHAWAALRVFEIDGSTDHGFLKRVLHKLMLNFAWWVNRKDADGNNVFEGGFLGLDNIGPFDRSEGVPHGLTLEQADATAWMGMYCLNLLDITLVLAEVDDTYEDLATKFFEHFAHIASAMNSQGLWSEDDGFYYDVLRTPKGTVPLEVQSMVGLIPLYAVSVLNDAALDRLPEFRERMQRFIDDETDVVDGIVHIDQSQRLLSIVSPDRLRRVLEAVLDEQAFLSDFGVRSLSAEHRDTPFVFEHEGYRSEVGYLPAESASGLFGGNSNWRGPVWFPVNYLIIESLRRYERFLGADFVVPCRSAAQDSVADRSLLAVADELGERLKTLFLRDATGRRPAHGEHPFFDTDPDVGDLIMFYEYFHGDTGRGMGASHQTGWTGLVADLIVGSDRP